MNSMPRTIYWKSGKVYILNQALLPFSIKYVVCDNYLRVARAIEVMEIRGAPAIGVAGAMGLALGAIKINTADVRVFLKKLDNIGKILISTRPTGYNLEWAVNRMLETAVANKKQPVSIIKTLMVSEANNILAEDIAMNKAIGDFGASLLNKGSSLLTHCNAGALATGGYGTALGVIRSAHKQKKVKRVYIDETRPRLQGARLTAFEMLRERIPATLISDNMAGQLMSKKAIDAVIVGADRIAANGDSANKIGTYSLAVLAGYHGIPFYIAAPSSTIDAGIKSGKSIVIEERSRKEILEINGRLIAPKNIEVYNPSFDVTPHELITAIITEKGILKSPDAKKMKNILE